MAAAPSPSTDVEVLKQQLQTEEQSTQPGGFAGFAAKLMERFNSKRKGPVTSRGLYQLALEAQEFDTACKQRLKAIDDKMNPIVGAAFEAHRRLTALVKEMKAGATNGRTVAATVKAEYDRLRLAENNAEDARRKAAAFAIEQGRRDAEAAEIKKNADAAKVREDAARIAAEQATAAGDAEAAEAAEQEAQHAAATQAIAAATAEQLKLEPITPTYVPVEQDAGKLKGSTTIFKKKGTVNPYSEEHHREGYCDPDALDLVQWLVTHPDAIGELIEWKDGGINRKLNNGVFLPGVAVIEVPESRNTARG